MEDLSLIEWGTSHFDDFLAESSDQELRDFLGQLSTAKQLVYGELINRMEKKDEKTNTLGGDNCFIGRVQPNEPDTKPERIVVTLPYGEHEFIAYNSDNPKPE